MTPPTSRVAVLAASVLTLIDMAVCDEMSAEVISVREIKEDPHRPGATPRKTKEGGAVFKQVLRGVVP